MEAREAVQPNDLMKAVGRKVCLLQLRGACNDIGTIIVTAGRLVRPTGDGHAIDTGCDSSIRFEPKDHSGGWGSSGERSRNLQRNCGIGGDLVTSEIFDVGDCEGISRPV